MILVQKEGDAKDLEAGQLITMIYAIPKGQEPVLLSAVVQPEKAWVGFALMGLGIAIAYSITIQNRAGMQRVSELDRWRDNPASPQTDITEKPTHK